MLPLTGHQHELKVCTAFLQQQPINRDILGGLRILLGADKGNVSIKVDLLPDRTTHINTKPSEPGRSDDPRRGETGCFPEERGSISADRSAALEFLHSGN